MRHLKKIATGILLLFYTACFSQSTYPIFEGLKTFYNQKANYTLNRELFTIRAKNESIPFSYIYVSKPRAVENALGEPFIYINDDTAKAAELCRNYTEKGLAAFHYKTFGTSDAYITRTLLSYSAESKAFLVFHELTHNYIHENCIDMGYSLNEAACDVIAVMFSKKLLREKHILQPERLNTEVRALETVYSVINLTIEKIKADSAHCDNYCEEAEQKIAVAVRNCDAFFKDRFLHPVTTAYLLKNSNYSRNYLMVKEIYADSKSLKKFMEALTFYTKE